MNAKLYRYVFWPIWFIAIPLGLAVFTVWAAASPAAEPGFFGTARLWIHTQKIPAIIVFFTVFEMVLYHFRHSLPWADTLGIAGRVGLPVDRRREFELAGQLLDECRRTLSKHHKAIESELAAPHREALQVALSSLESAMTAESFVTADFDAAYEEAATLADRHLRPWQRGELREYGESILIAFSVAALLRAFAFEAFQIPSGSMLPTLQIQDHIFVNKFVYGPTVPFTDLRLFPSMPPERGDVMVFKYPYAQLDDDHETFIKRVIALPGDEFTVVDGHPVINGWQVPYCLVGPYDFTGDRSQPKHANLFVEFLGDYSYLTVVEAEDGLGASRTYHVDDGEVWVLGDNRNNSLDSRYWRGGLGGGVPFANIKGRAMFVWASFNNRGDDFLGVTWDRLFTSVLGKPRLPSEASQELVAGIERCLSQRPAETTPPAPAPR